jgi:hypothetical protein
MEFRKVCVGGISYGTGVTEIGIARMKTMGQDTTAAEKVLEADSLKPKRRGVDIYCNFTDGCEDEGTPDRKLFSDIKKNDKQATLIKVSCLFIYLYIYIYIIYVLRCMVLTHSCISGYLDSVIIIGVLYEYGAESHCICRVKGGWH